MHSYRPNYQNRQPTMRQTAMDMEGVDGDPAPTFMNAKFNGTPAGDINPQEAIFDSGASHHLTGDKSALFNFTVLPKPIPLRGATNGKSQFVTAWGQLRFSGPRGTTVVINDVLYCSFANVTLILPAALCLQGVRFSFNTTDNSFILYSKSLPWFSLHLNCSLRKWSFPLPLRASSVSSPTAHVGNCYSFFNATPENVSELFPVPVPEPRPVNWAAPHLTEGEKLLLFYHKRFGHISLRTLRKMILLKIGEGLPKTLPPGKIHCPSCWIAKSTCIPTLKSENRKLERLEIINVDLIGPFKTEGFGRGKYLLTFRDSAMGFNEVKVIAKKSEPEQLIINFITRMENATGGRVKTLRSDNGGEFISNALTAYLIERGIKTERSIPYHRYQNGVIKWFNQTVQEIGRTLLLDSGLDQKFWGFAFQYTGVLLNRILNKASGDMSPFKAMYKRKPVFDRFKPFGATSTGFVHIPEEKRKKLDNWAYEGLMVLYLPDSKGWSFWVPAAEDFLDSAVVCWLDLDNKNLVPKLDTTIPDDLNIRSLLPTSQCQIGKRRGWNPSTTYPSLSTVSTLGTSWTRSLSTSRRH
jgi:hypothetical protein